MADNEHDFFLKSNAIIATKAIIKQHGMLTPNPIMDNNIDTRIGGVSGNANEKDKSVDEESSTLQEIDIRQGIDVIHGMIDISADRLEGLRTQCIPSAELTQHEIRMLETKLLCMFSNLLLRKAELSERLQINIKATSAELRKWLRVVGISSESLIAVEKHITTLDSLLNKTDNEIMSILSNDTYSREEDIRRLLHAKLNLRKCCECIQIGINEPKDLFWDSWDHNLNEHKSSVLPHPNPLMSNATLTMDESQPKQTFNIDSSDINQFNERSLLSSPNEHNLSSSPKVITAQYQQSKIQAIKIVNFEDMLTVNNNNNNIDRNNNNKNGISDNDDNNYNNNREANNDNLINRDDKAGYDVDYDENDACYNNNKVKSPSPPSSPAKTYALINDKDRMIFSNYLGVGYGNSGLTSNILVASTTKPKTLKDLQLQQLENGEQLEKIATIKRILNVQSETTQSFSGFPIPLDTNEISPSIRPEPLPPQSTSMSPIILESDKYNEYYLNQINQFKDEDTGMNNNNSEITSPINSETSNNIFATTTESSIHENVQIPPWSPCTPSQGTTPGSIGVSTGGNTRGMGHMITHRFTKRFNVISQCDLCNKQMFLGYKCKECKYRCHKYCKSNVPPSCGLPPEFIDVFKSTLQQSAAGNDSLHHSINHMNNNITYDQHPCNNSHHNYNNLTNNNISPDSQSRSHQSQQDMTTNTTTMITTTGPLYFDRYHQPQQQQQQQQHQSNIICSNPDSSGSSCNSSSPSSPALLFSTGYQPQHPIQTSNTLKYNTQFHFPDISQMYVNHNRIGDSGHSDSSDGGGGSSSSKKIIVSSQNSLTISSTTQMTTVPSIPAPLTPKSKYIPSSVQLINEYPQKQSIESCTRLTINPSNNNDNTDDDYNENNNSLIEDEYNDKYAADNSSNDIDDADNNNNNYSTLLENCKRIKTRQSLIEDSLSSQNTKNTHFIEGTNLVENRHKLNMPQFDSLAEASVNVQYITNTNLNNMENIDLGTNSHKLNNAEWDTLIQSSTNVQFGSELNSVADGSHYTTNDNSFPGHYHNVKNRKSDSSAQEPDYSNSICNIITDDNLQEHYKSENQYVHSDEIVTINKNRNRLKDIHLHSQMVKDPLINRNATSTKNTKISNTNIVDNSTVSIVEYCNNNTAEYCKTVKNHQLDSVAEEPDDTNAIISKNGDLTSTLTTTTTITTITTNNNPDGHCGQNPQIGSSSGGSGSNIDTAECDSNGDIIWPRQNSLSLKEWDIPYDDIELIEKIGKGRFGTVYRAHWHGDCAIKIFHKQPGGKIANNISSHQADKTDDDNNRNSLNIGNNGESIADYNKCSTNTVIVNSTPITISIDSIVTGTTIANTITSTNKANVEDGGKLEAFKLEVATFKKTRHANLILFMGACMKPQAIVTALCKGNTLHTHIHDRHDKFNLSRMTVVAQQIAQGMGYLHSRDIIHKDLTTKNIFLDNGKVVITDFGLFNSTKLYYSMNLGLSVPRNWICYLAPELVRSLKAYPTTFKAITDTIDNDEYEELPLTKSTDIYAFGTIWYQLLCGEFPFKSQPSESVLFQIGCGIKQSLANVQSTRDVKDILMLCWAYQADDRPDFQRLTILLDRLPKKRLARSPSHPVQLSRSAESVF